jgi:hypothetical protein
MQAIAFAGAIDRLRDQLGIGGWPSENRYSEPNRRRGSIERHHQYNAAQNIRYDSTHRCSPAAPRVRNPHIAGVTENGER